MNCGRGVVGDGSLEVNWVVIPGVTGNVGYKVPYLGPEPINGIRLLFRGPTRTDLRDRVLCVSPP